MGYALALAPGIGTLRQLNEADRIAAQRTAAAQHCPGTLASAAVIGVRPGMPCREFSSTRFKAARRAAFRAANAASLNLAACTLFNRYAVQSPVVKGLVGLSRGCCWRRVEFVGAEAGRVKKPSRAHSPSWVSMVRGLTSGGWRVRGRSSRAGAGW